MKKLVLILPFLLFVTNAASAQMIDFGVGAELGIPLTTDFKDVAGTAFGGTVMAKMDLPIVTVTGSVDYLSFGEKDLLVAKTSSSMWGINVGGRLSLLPLIYLGAEAGTYIISSKVQLTGLPEEKTSDTKFAFAPLVGFSLWKLHVDARYVIIQDSNMGVIRAMLFL